MIFKRGKRGSESRVEELTEDAGLDESASLPMPQTRSPPRG